MARSNQGHTMKFFLTLNSNTFQFKIPMQILSKVFRLYLMTNVSDSMYQLQTYSNYFSKKLLLLLLYFKKLY